MSTLWLYGGANGSFLQDGLCHMPWVQGLLQLEALSSWQATPVHLQETLKHSLSVCRDSGSWCAQISEKRREVKGKGERERYTHLNAEFQRTARRDKKVFLSDQCKEIEEKIEWERLEISLRKLEIPREHFMKRWAK